VCPCVVFGYLSTCHYWCGHYIMVPDYAMIGEITLYSFGYLHAKDCATKIVQCYKADSMGFHSSTSQLNLSRSCFLKTETSQCIPRKVLTSN